LKKLLRTARNCPVHSAHANGMNEWTQVHRVESCLRNSKIFKQMYTFLLDLQVHYRVHNSQQLDLILSQTNPVHTNTHYFPEIFRSQSSGVWCHSQAYGYQRSTTLAHAYQLHIVLFYKSVNLSIECHGNPNLIFHSQPCIYTTAYQAISSNAKTSNQNVYCLQCQTHLSLRSWQH
jgi:hypothetical protein